MRKYYDAQGNEVGTSQGGQGKIGQTILALVGLGMLIGAILLVASIGN